MYYEFYVIFLMSIVPFSFVFISAFWFFLGVRERRGAYSYRERGLSIAR